MIFTFHFYFSIYCCYVLQFLLFIFHPSGICCCSFCFQFYFLQSHFLKLLFFLIPARLFFHQAQRFGANIFMDAYFFIKRKGLAQTFSWTPIFSSSAKVWCKHFHGRLFFHQAQRFGANIPKTAYFFVKRKGLAQTFPFQGAPRFSFLCQKFPQACQNFSSVCFVFQSKTCKKSNAIFMQKERSEAKISKQSKAKKSNVFLSSSRKIPFVKRM